MTTIAYRDGVMASDTGVWIGDGVHSCARKLAVGADGTLYGGAGNSALVNTFLKWVDSGYQGDMPKPTPKGDDASSFVILISPPDGQTIRLLTAQGEEEYVAEYFAIGGGNATAFGALFAGASAETAIAATIEHGCSAHGKIATIVRTPKPKGE
jgi:hypothetical protein